MTQPPPLGAHPVPRLVVSVHDVSPHTAEQTRRWCDDADGLGAGHVDARDAVARLLAAADIALSPSSAETFGLATLEALVCGTPVVVPAAERYPWSATVASLLDCYESVLTRV